MLLKKGLEDSKTEKKAFVSSEWNISKKLEYIYKACTSVSEISFPQLHICFLGLF